MYNQAPHEEDRDVELHPISSYFKCPIISVIVERILLQFEPVVNYRRYNFTQHNLELYIILNFNKMFFNYQQDLWYLLRNILV